MNESFAIAWEADAPEHGPPAHSDTRAELAAELLHGSGLEIGALNWPLAVPPSVTVKYVDRMTLEDLRAEYPELDEEKLSRVDIVDDGELLQTVEDESLDFVIANHFLEHCQDPIRTIETHLSKLRPGGVLFYAVPDKRYTFDFRRPRTHLAHVVSDYENGPDRSRWDHYLEWERLVYEPGTRPPGDDEARRRAAEREAADYSIHFHVWTQADLIELLLHCRERFGGVFEIEAVRRRSIENIVVLRKRGELVAAQRDVPAARSTSPSPSNPEMLIEPGPSQPTGPTSEARIPLSALRSALDAGSAAAHWSVDVDGVPGRALTQSSTSVVSFPLRLERPVLLTARVMLLPHDWRDLRGSVHAWVAVKGADGEQRELWSGSLVCAADHGTPDGHHVDCELPSSTSSLLLGADPRPPRSGPPVGRVMWIDAEIVDRSAPLTAPRASETAPVISPLAERRPSSRPLVSVLTPVHDPPLEMLEETISSVRGQSFGDWELCLVDDGCSDPEVVDALHRHAASDERVRLFRREEPGGIATATNAALEMATGEYIALLDHDDLLVRHALELVARELEADPDLDMAYSDEAVLAEGRRIVDYLKPDWAPETLRSTMYTCHLGVYRRAIALEVGGFRPEFEGSQDYDFALRVIERTDHVLHIPHVLYHWRAHIRSAAGSIDAKPFAYGAGRRAIAAHLERTGRDAEVQFGPCSGEYRVVYKVDPSLTAALVVAVSARDGQGEAIAQAARSWLSQPHSAWKVVLAAPADVLGTCVGSLQAAGVDDSQIVTVATEANAGPATLLASAASAADADHLVLMESPVVGLTHDWLRRLLGYCAEPAIAAAGPIVLAPDGRIQDAGVAIANGIPLFLLHGADGADSGPLGVGRAVTNISALGGVVATRRDVFEALGGLRREMGNLTLIDYCLRAFQARMRVVSVGDARVRSVGIDGAINDLEKLSRLRQAWVACTSRDPYYNPNYRQDCGDFVPASRP